ncbi:hypothetical protein BJY24_004717 [Nocardia transvalensis]|uniref:Uncharacterized protein n=1 Tax=Nocardia transvalensis TaxID=37333 RepID=A0A7W9PH40_9NOCA|nr:hypothetical protein [Nocardia transvalensis]MBB5915805.1 hypothetical protein [Nocardia transvalensis]
MVTPGEVGGAEVCDEEPDEHWTTVTVTPTMATISARMATNVF